MEGIICHEHNTRGATADDCGYLFAHPVCFKRNQGVLEVRKELLKETISCLEDITVVEYSEMYYSSDVTEAQQRFKDAGGKLFRISTLVEKLKAAQDDLSGN